MITSTGRKYPSIRKLVYVLAVCAIVCSQFSFAQKEKLYEVTSGKIEFYSEAPKELISASSTKLKGVLDLNTRAFAFKIPMSSFQGFNSPLQREHFNENYMETSNYPEAVFLGKIIEEIDFSKTGTHEVRAKGRLTVHGITLERLIKSTLVIKDGHISISANFKVKLDDHNIKIPRVVFEKLSPEVNVSCTATLLPQK